jgi:RNA polymerase sigma-70 factor (ECF subfamily)
MRIRGDVLDDERTAVFVVLFAASWASVRHHVECVIDDHYLADDDDHDDDIADLVSEVFSLAWAKLEIDKPPTLAWLLRVADNKLRDWERRSLTRARAMDAVHSAAHARSALDPLDTMAVRHAVSSVLTPRERRFVLLFYWDRLAAGEIAEYAGCSQSVVFTTLSRARAKLHDELAGEFRPFEAALLRDRRIPYKHL